MKSIVISFVWPILFCLLICISCNKKEPNDVDKILAFTKRLKFNKVNKEDYCSKVSELENEVTMSFDQKGQLIKLKIINYHLEYIPGDINQFIHLKELDLRGNCLDTIPVLNLPELRYLNLRGNEFTTVPVLAKTHDNFSLSLSLNRFEEGFDLSSIPENCDTLDISFNEIKSISCTKSKKLYYLLLDGNGTTRFDSSVTTNLNQLKQISIMDSELKLNLKDIESLEKIVIPIYYELDTQLYRSNVKIIQRGNKPTRF